MNAEMPQATTPGAAAAGVASTSRPASPSAPRVLVLFLALLVVMALVANGLLWQKLSGIQETLARQSADAQSQ